MNILVIWKNDYPWDVRVEKISTTLASSGHDVHILARNIGQNPTKERLNNLYIHRLNPLRSRSLNSLFSIPIFLNPIWYTIAYKLCKEYSINLIIVRDLPLVPVGIRISKKCNIPIIFDMAEDYPAMWLDVIRDKWFKPSNYIFKNPFIGRLLENYCIRNVSHTLVVVEESEHRLLSKGSNNNISIVGNSPILNHFSTTPTAKNRFSRDDNIVLTYVGYVNKARGLDLVISALPALLERFNNICFVIAGDGKYIDQLRLLAKKLGVDKQVIFLGWVTFTDIPLIINASDICVIPHWATAHKNTTIPNKLFDYMASCKPVVVSDAKPLKRIVEAENCGLVFQSRNSTSLSSAIIQLARDPSLCKKLGNNGRLAVERQYNWEYDSATLVNVVKSLTVPKPV